MENLDTQSEFCESDASIVDSIVFGEELARQLAEIDSHPQREKEYPTIDLEDESEYSSSASNFSVSTVKTDRGVQRMAYITKTESNRFDQFGLEDPLPKFTATGTYSREVEPYLKVADVSPYPPPAPDQRRFNAKFPAPRPPTDSELPEHLRLEFFQRAKTDVLSEIEKVNAEKALFETFIKEKLQMNVFAIDLDNVKFGILRKGLPASRFIHSDLSRLKGLITCQLCEQIAINPRCCSNCSKLYCLGCARWLSGIPKEINIRPIKSLENFLCISGNCISAIDEDGYPRIASLTNQELIKMYEDAIFKCQRMYCDCLLKYNQVNNHYQWCKQGPIDWTVDQTLLLSFIGGPVRSVIESKPKTISSIIPSHLKLQNVNLTIPKYWRKRALCYAFLLKCYEENPNSITPRQLRTQANLQLNTQNNKTLVKNPSAPINESEKFLLDLGFPSCSKETIPSVPDSERQWPETWHPTVPWWLSQESTNWARFKVSAQSDGSSFSDTSSKILYALDIEDSETPFIRIDPFQRMSIDEAESIKKWLHDNFPSCWNINNRYENCRVSQNPQNVQTVQRKRNFLVNSFLNRPKANLPPMLSQQLAEIEAKAINCPDRHLTFSINMLFVTIREGEGENAKFMHRPCWLIILDGESNVIYETFVKHREIHWLNHRNHGLQAQDLKYARNLGVVRDQVVKYLACAKRIIGHGLINQLLNLGLTKDEIELLSPKFRDINNYYSPYNQNQMNLHAISFLWFCGYTLPAEMHSPAVEAITQLRLYLLNWLDIEKVAEINNGIHHRNANSTCGNKITSALLLDFSEGVKRRVVSWPSEWNQNRELRIPHFDMNCVAPDERIHKKAIDYIARHRNLDDLQVQEAMKPEFRLKRIHQMIKSCNRNSDSESEDESTPKFARFNWN